MSTINVRVDGAAIYLDVRDSGDTYVEIDLNIQDALVIGQALTSAALEAATC
jgi:hypothetical protein